MHESGIAGGESNRYPRPYHRTLPGLQYDTRCRHQIDTCITRMSGRGKRDFGIKTGEKNLRAGHGREDYPETVNNSTGMATNRRFRYKERLYVPWWGWPLPLALTAVLAASVHLGYSAVPAWLPYTALLPLTAILLLALGRLTVRVTEGEDSELWVGKAHLPLHFIDTAEVIGKQDKRRALGPELDPTAFLAQRDWITTLVRVHLADPDDPTPYWLISTRHPERLATLLTHRSPENTSASSC